MTDVWGGWTLLWLAAPSVCLDGNANVPSMLHSRQNKICRSRKTKKQKQQFGPTEFSYSNFIILSFYLDIWLTWCSNTFLLLPESCSAGFRAASCQSQGRHALKHISLTAFWTLKGMTICEVDITLFSLWPQATDWAHRFIRKVLHKATGKGRHWPFFPDFKLNGFVLLLWESPPVGH